MNLEYYILEKGYYILEKGYYVGFLNIFDFYRSRPLNIIDVYLKIHFPFAFAFAFAIPSPVPFAGTYKGSYTRPINKVRLRYLGKELVSNLRIRSPRHYSTLSTLNPWFITGFADGEGCFTLSVIKDKERKVGWRVFHSFKISLHVKDKALLEQIQSYFSGLGSITKERSDSIQYRIQSVENLIVVLNHFYSYPLITQKWEDYQLFKQAIMLIKNKEHLTFEGLRKILAIKSVMNNGLSDELKAAFPDITQVERPSVLDSRIKDPNWVAGFASAEGCFYIKVRKSKSARIGYQVQLYFSITQHTRDESILVSLISYLESGSCRGFKGNWGKYECFNFSDIISKILPFFNQYPILGVKSQDFDCWCRAVEIIQAKGHLTTEGLSKIIEIKESMNKLRLIK